MPMHDWTRVPAGIFHAFHHALDLRRSAIASMAGFYPEITMPCPSSKRLGSDPMF